MYTARVQHEARKELLRKLDCRDVVIGFDFARNFEFYRNFTITERAFSTAQAVILPIYVARHASTTSVVLEDDDSVERLFGGLVLDDDSDSEIEPHVPEIIFETYFFVTTKELNHPKKNPSLLHHCLEKVFDLLNVGVLGGTRRVYLYSDGELRTRHHFAWLGRVGQRLKTDLYWSFYASNHGKDLYDSEGGVFKCGARRFVRDRGQRDSNPIQSAAQLVDYGRTHLAFPSKKVKRRHFFHVDVKLDIPRDAVPVHRSSDFYAFHVKGTRGSNTVYAKEFSCFCDQCLRGHACSRQSSSWTKTDAGYI